MLKKFRKKIIATVLLVLNALNMLDDDEYSYTKIEDYSQPFKLILLINAVTIFISQSVRQLEGDILLLSIGLVFVIGYFLQKDKSIKNVGSIHCFISFSINGLYVISVPLSLTEIADSCLTPFTT